MLLLDQPSVGVDHDQTPAPDLDGSEPAVADHLVYCVLPETGEDAKLVNRCGNGIGCRRLKTLRNIPQRETNQFFDFLFKNLDPLLQGIDLLSRTMQHSHNSTQIFR